MKIKELTAHLEAFAPPAYQEPYDNARLITGSGQWECTGTLLCLDALETVLDEAIALKCNLVIAHHPIIFSGLKSLTGANYIERTVIKAIKNDIAIYAIHTNLDNVAAGVNARIADKLGLKNTKVLSPKAGILRKLYTYVPTSDAESVLNALFAAGAGEVGHYSECSFSVSGTGSFKGDETTDPHVGKKGERHYEQEKKIEVLFPAERKAAILSALFASHPYEEVAYEIVALENTHQDVGSGLIGELEAPVPTLEFLREVKAIMRSGAVRYTAPVTEKVSKIAVCGGAGSFLLGDAIRAGADVFITSDYKYHQFFDADGRITIADIGHYESEQYTQELIYDVLSDKFGTFALHLSKVNTNPINYL